jgi:predicted permease
MSQRPAKAGHYVLEPGIRIDNSTLMLKDLRHGIRVLLQAKGWSAVIVLSLAVGMGANAALFGAVNAQLLSKLAVGDPDSLVRFKWTGQNDMANDTSDYGYNARTASGDSTHSTFSYPMFEHFRSTNGTLTDLAASRPMGRITAIVDGRAELVNAVLATGDYHAMLGVTAQIGRTITLEDDRRTAPPVGMLSDRYWRARYSADPTVIGKVIKLGPVPVTIIGVLQPSFTGTQRPTVQLADISIPLVLEEQIGTETSRLSDPTNWWVQIIGRRKPGISADQVRGNFEGVFQSQARAGMDAHLASLTAAERNLSRNRQRTAVPRLLVDSGSRGIYDANASQIRALTIIGIIVALVLLLVCANVANLLLSRATTRAREMSVRLSIGATRQRLVRQLLTESLLLSAAGGALGVLLAYWTQDLLPAPIGEASPDWRVFAFMLAITAVTGIVFGIAPALRATQGNAGEALRENSRSVAGSSSLLSRALLVIQLAISLALLVGAGLFLRTLDNLRQVDVGFDPENLVFVRVNPDVRQYDEQYRQRYFQEGIARLQGVPGVRAATVSFPTLLSGSVNGTVMYVRGRTLPGSKYDSERDDIDRVVVAPNYFATLGVPLAAGRSFTERDDARAPSVAIINEAAARKFFPNQNAVGQRFGHSIDNTEAIEIVGVLRDVRYNSLREPAPPTLYTPYLQRGPNDLVFTIRTGSEPTNLLRSIRTAISQVDPNIPIMTVETQLSQLELRYSEEKVLAQAYSLFGAIAVFVAAIGLFGLMSYSVSRRTREIGIRMAMGAQRENVLGLVLRESMVLVIIGIVIGVTAALAAGRLIESQLFGLEPTDTATMLSAVALMIAVSAAAGYLPARRATRVDPMVALRYE